MFIPGKILFIISCTLLFCASCENRSCNDVDELSKVVKEHNNLGLAYLSSNAQEMFRIMLRLKDDSKSLEIVEIIESLIHLNNAQETDIEKLELLIGRYNYNAIQSCKFNYEELDRKGLTDKVTYYVLISKLIDQGCLSLGGRANISFINYSIDNSTFYCRRDSLLIVPIKLFPMKQSGTHYFEMFDTLNFVKHYDIRGEFQIDLTEYELGEQIIELPLYIKNIFTKKTTLAGKSRITCIVQD